MCFSDTDVFNAVANTRWKGTNELWLDPLGNIAITSDATMVIEKESITYSWEYEGGCTLLLIEPYDHAGVRVCNSHCQTQLLYTCHSLASESVWFISLRDQA